jgi:hypothetical protein
MAILVIDTVNPENSSLKINFIKDRELDPIEDSSMVMDSHSRQYIHDVAKGSSVDTFKIYYTVKSMPLTWCAYKALRNAGVPASKIAIAIFD